jgi:hypothetical protein
VQAKKSAVPRLPEQALRRRPRASIKVKQIESIPGPGQRLMHMLPTSPRITMINTLHEFGNVLDLFTRR